MRRSPHPLVFATLDVRRGSLKGERFPHQEQDQEETVGDRVTAVLQSLVLVRHPEPGLEALEDHGGPSERIHRESYG